VSRPKAPPFKLPEPQMDRVLLPTTLPNYSVNSETGDIRIRPREKLLERLAPTAEQNEAFDQLHERLAAYTEMFLHRGDGGRAAVFWAMKELIRYLTSQGIPQAALRPIEAVMIAIIDADNGTSSPISEPQRKGGGGSPRKSVMQVEFEGKLAIVMECCVRHFRSEGRRPFVGPASKLAARMINESAWPVRVTSKQLREIRERIQQTKGFAYDRAEVDGSISSEVAQSAPLEWARLLLSHEWVNPPPKVSG
jgi:hypothetical protein